jgi:hypothetical protein
VIVALILAGEAPTARAASANLGDVACATPGNCAAVGTAATGSGGSSALLYTQSLGTWSRGTPALLPVDAGAGSFSSLFSVACATAGACVAAGDYTDRDGAGQGLLVSQTNGTWAAGVAAPLPADAAAGSHQSAQLGDVTCPGPGNCTAIGEYVDAAGNGRPMMLTESNGTWATGIEGALPADAASGAGRQFARLSSVSCPAAGNCTAVGTYQDSAHRARGLVLTEATAMWARGVAVRLPADAGPDSLTNPSGHFNYGLNQVSCRAVGECTVIGEYANRAGLEQGLVLTEHQGRWSRGVQPRLPANAATARFRKSFVLWSASCTSASNCTAVGWYADRSGQGVPLVVTERNGRWQRGIELRAPANVARNGDQATELEAVSCASAGNCTAVGAYPARNNRLEGLLATETRGRWGRATPAILPANGRQAAPAISDEQPGLYRVACASAGNCSAIGTYALGPDRAQGMLLSQAAGQWARAVQALF